PASPSEQSNGVRATRRDPALARAATGQSAFRPRADSRSRAGSRSSRIVACRISTIPPAGAGGTIPHMSENKTYEGSCHCGAVRYEVTMAPPEKAFACNCSICSRAGWLLAFVPEETFRLVSGESALEDYQFGKKHIHHYFCR